jgi:hypothetical protein
MIKPICQVFQQGTGLPLIVENLLALVCIWHIEITIETPLFTCMLYIDLADEHFFFFTKSLPKCPKFTRAPSQAFSFAEDFWKGHLKAHLDQNHHCSWHGYPRLHPLQFLFDPMIHHDLSGVPTIIIGNSSNKKEGIQTCQD